MIQKRRLGIVEADNGLTNPALTREPDVYLGSDFIEASSSLPENLLGLLIKS